MDARKRPRSSTPTKDGTPTRKKNKKDKSKTKKTKKNRSNSIEGRDGATTKPKNSLDSTATTDGQMMALMYSTFSKLEQSRFEAFQRASFRVDAIGDWVAACLSNRMGVVAAAGNHHKKRTLEDLVAVGQAGEIRTVVAVLAKIYASRLIQAAAKLANNKNKKGGENNTNTNNTAFANAQAGAGESIQPLHILQALEERQAIGLDPGFFLQNASERPDFVLESKESFDERRLAAFEAQEEYDRQQEQRRQEAEKEGGDKDKSGDGESKMDTT